MAREYSIYDVFTDRRLAGNPLAVIHDSDGLDDEAMQKIARELNLSETVFVFAASNPAHSARLRIFTPGRELPFAGHPTVGAAIALAERQYGTENGDLDLVSVLEETVGPVRCAVRLRSAGVAFAEFDLPQLPQRLEHTLDRQGVADAFSLKVTDIGFENHVPSVWTAGVPFVVVPLHNLRAAQSLEYDPALWEKVAPFAQGSLVSTFVYCRGGVNHASKFHARMFAVGMGIHEDPATGAAVAALSGAIQHFDDLPDGHHPMIIEQGVEMGRPSFIHLHIDTKEGAISRARIGGQAIKVASGTLDL